MQFPHDISLRLNISDATSLGAMELLTISLSNFSPGQIWSSPLPSLSLPESDMAVGQNQYHFGVGAPPILEPILVGIGMFTGGTGF